jgi:hypothetical protein
MTWRNVVVSSADEVLEHARRCDLVVRDLARLGLVCATDATPALSAALCARW